MYTQTINSRKRFSIAIFGIDWKNAVGKIIEEKNSKEKGSFKKDFVS